MTKPTASSRRQRAERNQQEASQEASSGGDQASVFITRDEIQLMMTSMQEQMMKRQEEMVQTLLGRLGQAGATGAQANGTEAGLPNRQANGMVQQGDPLGQPTADGAGLGGIPPVNVGPTGGRVPAGVAQTNANANVERRDEEYVPEFPHGLGGNLDLELEIIL